MSEPDLIDRALRERAGRWVATARAAPPLRPMLDHALGASAGPGRRWSGGQLTWLSAAVGVLVVAAVVALVAVLRPDVGSGPAAHVPSSWTPNNPGGLTTAEYDLALRIAHQKADTSSGAAVVNGWPTTLTSVTALALPRAAANAYANPGGVTNTHLPERVLVLRLVGSFPRVTVLPPPCGLAPDACAHLSVTELDVIVDPQTGKQLTGGVSTAPDPAPLPGGTVLFRR